METDLHEQLAGDPRNSSVGLRFGLKELFTAVLICFLVAGWCGDHLRLKRKLARAAGSRYTNVQELCAALRDPSAIGQPITAFPDVLVFLQEKKFWPYIPESDWPTAPRNVPGTTYQLRVEMEGADGYKFVLLTINGKIAAVDERILVE